MIKNTGIVNAGFNRYRIDGLNIGSPPTEAMLTKKNMMLTIIRQNPIEYISCLSNSIIFFDLFKKNLGRIAAPMKKATNPISSVIVRLAVIGFKDSNRNIANRNRTINGLKR
jgi:hypothetical protein